MAAPTILFHIGAHKTGTSYLQHVFRELTPALREAGVLVPDAWRRGRQKHGHHRLADDLAHGLGHAKDLVASIADEIKAIVASGCTYALVSSGGLSTMKFEQVKLLASLLQDVDARFVFYCRRWSDAVPSHWQETIRHGATHSLPEQFKRLMADVGAQDLLNFDRKLDPFVQCFGRSSISLASYSNVVDSGVNLARHFLENFLPTHHPDLDAAAGILDQWRHPSMPVWQIEIIRNLNVIAQRFGERRSEGPRQWFVRNLQELDLDHLQKLIEPARRTITIDDNRPELLELHESLFKAWGDRFVGPRTGELLFQPRVREVEYVRSQRFERPAIERRLVALYSQYRGDHEAGQRSNPVARRVKPGAMGSRARAHCVAGER